MAPAGADGAVTLFAGPRGPIRVSGLALLQPALAEFPSAWPQLGEVPAGDDRPLDVRIEAGVDGIRVIEGAPPRAESLYEDAEDAALGLVGALIGAYVAQDPALVCFHAAATRVTDGLVVMMGDTGAGKSTLAAHLVQRGLRSFGDDRLAVHLSPEGHDEGIALAIPHKLRLPLPDDAGAGFASFVEARAAKRWVDRMRLRLQDGEAAAFGTRAPLRALVVLARADDLAPSLEPAPVGLVVRELVRHSFAPHLGGEDLLRALVGLAGRVPGYRLSYARSADAAALVARRFGTPAPEAAS
jgi:hypothetical protein